MPLLLVKVVEVFLFIDIIMAKRYKNDKDFLIIEMSYKEASQLYGFGTNIIDEETGLVVEHIVKCDTCNNKIIDNIYYVAAINSALCKECCDDFINGYDKNPEDEIYEKRHYNYYAKQLNLEEVCI